MTLPTPYLSRSRAILYQGHVLEILRGMPDESVHCVITSPPYYGLRAYKTVPQVWGGTATCGHLWRPYTRPGQSGGTASPKVQIKGEENFQIVPPTEQAVCEQCGAWRGELGMEPTPELYVAHLVEIFREARRVLRKDGTLWLNLGDAHAGSGKGLMGDGTHCDADGTKQGTNRGAMSLIQTVKSESPGLKPKDLIGIPWHVAFALQADGWWLRSDIIWEKANCMPESVTDRPTHSHEYVFLLTKSPRYFYDAEAVKEPCQSGASDIRKMMEGLPRIGGKHKTLVDPLSKASVATNIGRKRSVGNPSGRNRRSVWAIATEPVPFAHFACFPQELVETCLKAGTSERGCCPGCGKPWERVVGKPERTLGRGSGNKQRLVAVEGERGRTNTHLGSSVPREPTTTPTIGWKPTCGHATEPVPCTVLDIFSGSGTTLLVAQKLGRIGIGIELNPGYCAIAERRLAQEVLGL